MNSSKRVCFFLHRKLSQKVKMNLKWNDVIIILRGFFEYKIEISCLYSTGWVEHLFLSFVEKFFQQGLGISQRFRIVNQNIPSKKYRVLSQKNEKGQHVDKNQYFIDFLHKAGHNCCYLRTDPRRLRDFVFQLDNSRPNCAEAWSILCNKVWRSGSRPILETWSQAFNCFKKRWNSLREDLWTWRTWRCIVYGQLLQKCFRINWTNFWNNAFSAVQR